MAPLRVATLFYAFAAVSGADGQNDTLSLLQAHAVKLIADDPVATDTGNWWPTDCAQTHDFELSTPKYSNLGGGGPDTDSPAEILYDSAGIVDGQTVDIIVKATGDHTSAHPKMNGVKPGSVIGRINVQSGRSTSLSFSIINSATKQPQSVEYMALTFFDIDEGKDGNSRTTVTVPGATDLYVHGSTELTLADDCTGVTSSTKGTGKDNPHSVATLDDLQLSRTATFIVGPGSSWNANFDVADPKMKSGRLIMFKLEAVIPCQVDGGSRCGGPKPTTTTTTTTTVPSTCGNACTITMPYKKCAFWGDPHYQKTFNAAPPNFGNNYNLQGTGIMRLAQTKCGSIEIQSVQCPWGGAAIAYGFAFRVGSSVATIIGNTIRNPDGIKIEGGNPRTIISSDSCAQLWVKTNGNVAPGAPYRLHQYYMDMEIKVDDPELAAGSNCDGRRLNIHPSADETLFTTEELRGICGPCRFACPGALLTDTPDDLEGTPVTAEEMCTENQVSYDEADKECQALGQQTKEGGDAFHHDSCIMDFCASGGMKSIIADEIATEEHFENDDEGKDDDEAATP